MQILFIILSVIDLVLSSKLETLCCLDELNPVACIVLRNTGLIGLALFKLTIVAIVILLCQYINRHSEKYNGLVEKFAVMITGGVVAYTFILMNS